MALSLLLPSFDPLSGNKILQVSWRGAPQIFFFCYIPCVVQYIPVAYFIPKSLYLLIHHLYHAAPLCPLVTTSLYSISVFVCFVILKSLLYFSLDSTCNRYHTVFVFLCLTYFIWWYHTHQVHLCCYK